MNTTQHPRDCRLRQGRTRIKAPEKRPQFPAPLQPTGGRRRRRRNPAQKSISAELHNHASSQQAQGDSQAQGSQRSSAQLNMVRNREKTSLIGYGDDEMSGIAPSAEPRGLDLALLAFTRKWTYTRTLYLQYQSCDCNYEQHLALRVGDATVGI